MTTVDKTTVVVDGIGNGEDINAIPPEIPHITTNMTPLNVILERVALETFKRLSEFFKYLESGNEMKVVKKKHFLELLVAFRENFVRLYVLCKWSRNNESISKLIDLFVWLRDQNQQITDSIMSFGAIKSSLISAKMPEPDLLTSLEVLLQGRPNLPTYNFLPEDKLKPQFALDVLKNLNVELSIKMALEKNLPKAFKKFSIKDGCIQFNVPNYFSCSLSMLNDEKFYLIDFKLGFSLISNEIKSSDEEIDHKALIAIQKYSNKLLNDEGLDGLYNLLFNYSITSKLYLMHKQLINFRMRLWRGHLTHNYNAESSIIVITYWVQRKYAKPSTIEIGKFNDNSKLSFKWFKDGILDESHNLQLCDNNDDVDLLKLINSIIKLHIQSILIKLQKSLVESIEDIEKSISLSNNLDKLTFKISQSKEIVYSIDSLSGSCYFENPTNIMNRSAFKINSGNNMDFIEILNLKMMIQESEFSSMMNATGWVNLKSIRLSQEEILKLNINYSKLKNYNLKQILTSIGIYRRKDWPIGWFILVGNFGFKSNVQLWCSKIQSIQAQWIINWCSEINMDDLNYESLGLPFKFTPTGNSLKNDEDITDEKKEQQKSLRSLTYNDLVNLVKISSSKLISNLIVKELTDEGCQLKVLNSSDKLVNDFLLSNFNVDNMNSTSTDNAVLLIKNKSLFHIQSAKDSLVLLINIKNSDLNAKIYGKLTNDDGVKNLPDIKYNDENSTQMEYDSNLKIFKIESYVDLSNQFSTNNDNSTDKDNLILSNILSFLKKFAKLLNLLRLISSNPALKIIKVLSDGVTFKYGENEEEFITLKISRQGNDNISVELPENNPHNYCLPYLSELISKDQVNYTNIKEFVLYLRLTLKFCRKVQDLRLRTSLDLEKFNQKNEAVDYEINPDDLQNIPAFGYLPFICNLENLRIVYFKNVKVDIQQSTGKKKSTKTVSDIFKFEIKIEFRHRTNRLSRKHSLFFITLGNLRCEAIGNINSSTMIFDMSSGENTLVDISGKVSNFLEKYFSGEEFPANLKNGNEVFLKDGLCCGFETIDLVMEDLHTKLYNLMS